jgi:hypothetical protein
MGTDKFTEIRVNCEVMAKWTDSEIVRIHIVLKVLKKERE